MKHPMLFGASPLGAGSGGVESLSGFYARLCLSRYALAGHVLRRMVLPRMPAGTLNEEPVALANVLRFAANRLDLNPKVAAPFASALEELTSSSGLARHTFIVAPRLWPARHRMALGTPLKKWCPVCFAVPPGGVRYEPLLWRFGIVARCPIHRNRLIDKCSVCDRPQPVVTQRVPLGHCVHCGHGLAEGGPWFALEEAALDVRARWALWRSVAVSRMVAWSSGRGLSDLTIDAGGFARLLQFAAHAAPGPRSRSRSGLEVVLGILGSKTFLGTVDGRDYSLETVLDVSMQFGVDPVRVINGEFREGERSWPPDGGELLACDDPWTFALEVREAASAERHPEQARLLDEFIADPAAVDFAALLRRNGFNAITLARRFPRRQARAQQLRASRLRELRAHQVDRCRLMLENEIGSGAPRSLKAVARSNGLSVSTLKYHAPDLVSKLVEIRSLRSTGRYRSRLRSEGPSVWKEALESPQVPTFEEVAKRLGVPAKVLIRAFPAECRELRARRDRGRASREARYREAMRLELTRSSPRSARFVARRLGVTNATLKRVAPDLYARLLGRAASVKVERTSPPMARVPAHVHSRRRLEAALRKELRTSAPRSAGAVAKALGLSMNYQCVSMLELARELRERREELRGLALERARVMLETEIGEASPRSVSAIARAVGISKTSLERRYPELVARLVDAHRMSGVRVPSPSTTLTVPDADRYRAVLQAEVRSEQPRSLAEVARSLGVTEKWLLGADHESARRLLDRRAAAVRRERERLKRCVELALQRELDAKTPRPVAQIARELGIDRQQVSRLAPDLVRQVVTRRVGAETYARYAHRTIVPNQ